MQRLNRIALADGLLMPPVLEVGDVIHFEGYCSWIRMRPDNRNMFFCGGLGGLLGAQKFATQVSCPMFSYVITRFSGFISNSRYNPHSCVVAPSGLYVQCYIRHTVRRGDIRSYL